MSFMGPRYDHILFSKAWNGFSQNRGRELAPNLTTICNWERRFRFRNKKRATFEDFSQEDVFSWFFSVFSSSWKTFRVSFSGKCFHYSYLFETHLLSYNMSHFYSVQRIGPPNRDATATRMTKLSNSINPRNGSLIPTLINTETFRVG